MAVGALKNAFGSVHFSGDYATWDDAKKQCEGYGAEVILERVAAAAAAVRDGKAAYERDSLLFYEQAYEWPMLACLLWAASRQQGELSVLDFGGSLGSTYYQHRKWFKSLTRLRWSIVEQEHFVRAGREHFQDEILRFYPDVEACLSAERPNVLFLSGVLQYLSEPLALLDGFLAKGFEAVLIDRTPLLEGSRSRITLQKVSARIYPATYPAWFFSRRELLEVFEGRYRLVEAFDAMDRANVPGSKYQGLLFERVPA